jgi:2,6-dihydroxypyridine 3-monooxygenase
LRIDPAMYRFLTEFARIDIEAISTRALKFRHIDRDGRIIHDEDTVDHRHTSWRVLYRGLLGCVDPANYHLGHRLVGIEQEARAVTARFADGAEASADILVCADGILSTARSVLAPGLEPSYAGYLIWRAMVPEVSLDAETRAAFDDAITFCALPRSHMVGYPIPGNDGSIEPGRRNINLGWYWNVEEGEALDGFLADRDGVTHRLSLPPGAVTEENAGRLRAAARDECPPAFADAFGTADRPFLQKIVDIEPPAQSFGRVCLLGDAAFVSRPHAASGTAKAAEDAWTLAEAVKMAGSGGLVTALAAWSDARVSVGRDLVGRSREIGDRYQVTGDVDAADLALRPGLHRPVR